MDLSLVIACYNEEYELVDSVRQIVDILGLSRLTYELNFRRTIAAGIAPAN